MARAFVFLPTAPQETAKTARMGAGNTANDRWGQEELGKLVKLAGESRMDLCAAGNEIEGVVSSVENATQDGYTIGGFISEGRILALADGLQATPGTGVIALGDYVVAGTATAKGTALTSYPKVCTATPLTVGTTPAVNFPAGSNLNFKWKVVSLGSAGTGAVGTTICLERIGG